MAKLSLLCQVNGGCMGCCGHDFKSKAKIKEAIKRNTKEFSFFENLQEFRDRAEARDLRFGVCRNLIEKDKLLCPLHPSLNSIDLREGHCDVNHLCNTAREFAEWSSSKQEKFLSFIKSKELDNIEYSLMMDNGKLLEEFHF
tara:strand:- start:93 stop:518 length:426 start_codon:yes stop_codon:yes gene_type:complete